MPLTKNLAQSSLKMPLKRLRFWDNYRLLTPYGCREDTFVSGVGPGVRTVTLVTTIRPTLLHNQLAAKVCRLYDCLLLTYILLTAGCWLPVAGCRLLTTDYSTTYQLIATGRWIHRTDLVQVLSGLCHAVRWSAPFSVTHAKT